VIGTSHAASASASADPGSSGSSSIGGVLRNRRFLALWLAQVATQVGANMVLYGLTVLVYGATRSNSAVSLLILTFLVPAVLFSAVAGVYVDRLDRRLLLVIANAVRAVAFVAMFLVDQHLAFIYLLNILVSTATTFFVPAEAAMIPILVDRRQLLAANGLFAFTLQASFAIGFAVLGPFVVKLAGVDALLILVAVLYVAAAGLCFVLPSYRPPTAGSSPEMGETGRAAVAGMFGQLREGVGYIRSSRSSFWALTYLAITASLIGVLGVLGPDFATRVLGLREDDLVVVVLPLGAGIVMGILLLNVYGKFIPRRRVIEGGLIGLGLALGVLAVAGPLSRALQSRVSPQIGDFVSLLSIVVLLALAMGVAYAFVAVPAQTQLQEELPEDVRGRVFGVLNMLVSVSSFVPIVVVGPLSDFVGTTNVILVCAALVVVVGFASIRYAPPHAESAEPSSRTAPVDPVAVTTVPLRHARDADGLPGVPDVDVDGIAAPDLADPDEGRRGAPNVPPGR
jgi:MFS family permease